MLGGIAKEAVSRADVGAGYEGEVAGEQGDVKLRRRGEIAKLNVGLGHEWEFRGGGGRQLGSRQ
jgi:hypothetical protein